MLIVVFASGTGASTAMWTAIWLAASVLIRPAAGAGIFSGTDPDRCSPTDHDTWPGEGANLVKPQATPATTATNGSNDTSPSSWTGSRPACAERI
jgi:hypothetical protein